MATKARSMKVLNFHFIILLKLKLRCLFSLKQRCSHKLYLDGSVVGPHSGHLLSTMLSLKNCETRFRTRTLAVAVNCIITAIMENTGIPDLLKVTL